MPSITTDLQIALEVILEHPKSFVILRIILKNSSNKLGWIHNIHFLN
jgi:hypothetical protein